MNKMKFVFTIQISRKKLKLDLHRVSSFQCRCKTQNFAKHFLLQTFQACSSEELDLFGRCHMRDMF